jgi:hypothetical protein
MSPLTAMTVNVLSLSGVIVERK